MSTTDTLLSIRDQSSIWVEPSTFRLFGEITTFYSKAISTFCCMFGGITTFYSKEISTFCFRNNPCSVVILVGENI